MRIQQDKTIRNISSNTGIDDIGVIGRAFLILSHTHNSARAVLRAFDIFRKKRKGGQKGGTTDEEQDLLRAMLVLVSAGIDSTTKQLIRDALPAILDCQETAMEGLRTFMSRSMRTDDKGVMLTDTKKFLADILTSKSPRDCVIEEYIASLTADSLQSTEVMWKSVSALGLREQDLEFSSQKLKGIFDIRNQIIHELDINFNAKRRHRHIRKRSEMVAHVNHLLELGELILIAVNKKLIAKV